MNNKEFNLIYERNYRRSFLFVKSYVHDDMVAEDIVIDSLVSYWKTLTSNNAEVSEALLLVILKNKSLDYLRSEQVRLSTIENLLESKNRELNMRISTLEACNPNEIFSKEIKLIIQQTLQALPKQTSQIFIMSRFKNMTVKEIAEKTGLTVKGVEYHITKSIKAMRIGLKDYLPLFFFLFH